MHSTPDEEEKRRADFAELDAAAAASAHAPRETAGPVGSLRSGDLLAAAEPQRRLEALWAGEAAKAWWCNLTERERQQIELMEPRQLFIMGWQCGRAKAAND